jgi:hypothetical protein
LFGRLLDWVLSIEAFFCGSKKHFLWKLQVVSHFIMWCNMRDFGWALRLKPFWWKKGKLVIFDYKSLPGLVLWAKHKKILLGPKRAYYIFHNDWIFKNLIIFYWKGFCYIRTSSILERCHISLFALSKYLVKYLNPCFCVRIFGEIIK